MSRPLLAALGFVLAAPACDRTSTPTAVNRIDGDVAPEIRLDVLMGTVLTIQEDLGTLGGAISEARDINNFNQVTGYSTTGTGESRAFFWTPQDGMVDVNAGGSTIARVGEALNDAGQIAASGSAPSTSGSAALRGSPPYPSAPLDLGKLAGFDSFSHGINSAGVVVGSSENPSLSPFIWVAPGPMQALAAAGGFALDINDAGTVAGATVLVGGKLRAFRKVTSGSMVNLGTLGGDQSVALGINASDDIVGWANTSQAAQHAARWAAGSSNASDLGTFTGGTSSTARDVNDFGAIVGSSTNSAGGWLGAMWSPGRSIRALRPLFGGTKSEAFGINNAGHASGYSDVSGGDQHAVVWWNYRLVNVIKCICRPEFPPNPELIAIRIFGGRKLDVASIEPRLFTLGDGRGNDAPILVDDGGGPVYEIGDANADGFQDMLLYFDRTSLSRRGARRIPQNPVVLLGVLRDRSNAVFGLIPLRRID